MNRSNFLIRLLRYYKEIGFEGCICIGDSSSAEHVERTKKVIETLRGKLNIIYQEYPDLNDAICLKRLLDFVSTPYAAFVADDDFLVPDALNQCVKFLGEHPDYAAAHGMGITITLNSKGLYGQIIQCGHYRQPVIEAKSASQRLDDHLGHYSVTLFSVHRIESWRAMYRDVHLLRDRGFGGELFPCCKSVILGKSKELDCLYLVRQMHTQRNLLPDTYDWITSSEWYSSYLVFRDSLAETLALQDNISLEKAEKAVKQAFWSYLAMGVSYQPDFRRDFYNRYRQVAGIIPGARRIWQLLRSLRSKQHFKLSLRELLKSSSPYHADFMPVYKALTTPPTEFSNETTGKYSIK
jgi:glycosyltransferase domain-containing protein